MVVTLFDQRGHDDYAYGRDAFLWNLHVLVESSIPCWDVVVFNGVTLGPTPGQLEAVPQLHIS
jgi:hypothetical protein